MNTETPLDHTDNNIECLRDGSLRVSELIAQQTETPSAPSHTPEPWHYCGQPEKVCKCMMISDERGPICTVTSGDWGDDYPAIRFVEGDAQGGIDAKVEAYMDQITYGSVSKELAGANAKRIVACVNSMAGIANPEAVGEVIEAAREMRHVHKTMMATGKDFYLEGAQRAFPLVCNLIEALAALEETK